LILLVAIVCALFAPWIAPHDPDKMNPLQRLKPPGGEHPLGTDPFGRDLASRILAGSRVSLSVGVLVVAVTSVVGIAVGVTAGTFRRVDNVFMRIMDGMMAFPDILLAIAIMGALGRQFSNVVIALAIVYTPRVARIVRSQALVIREQPFVEAARAIGLSGTRIVMR